MRIKKNICSYQQPYTQPRFEREACSNSEMAQYNVYVVQIDAVAKGYVAQLEMHRNGEQRRTHTRIHLHVHLLLQLKDRFSSIHSCSTSYKWSEKYVKRLLDANILPTQCTDFDQHITKHSMGSEHVCCTQYPMQYPQFFRCFFSTVTKYISKKVAFIIAKMLFFNVIFFFFAVLYICSISFYNFFGLAVTKSLTGKGGKNCLTYTCTKGSIVLFCAPFTPLYPRIPCAYVHCCPNFLHPALSLSRN